MTEHTITGSLQTGLRIGEVIQRRYIVERDIGEGGMGRIYLARQLPFERLVAIKVMHPHHSAIEELVGRFLQEAQIISRLSHPNTVTVYEVLRHNKLLCIVMEYVEGQTLGRHLKQYGPLPISQAVVFALQIAQSLGEAHRKGVVHRDVKPDNIMVCSPKGAEPFLKVLDFGVAKLQDAVSRQTQAQAVVGTPYYMSPEQVEGREADERADLYSLACCMVEMLTGEPPFQGNTSLKVMLQHRESPPPPLGPAVPPALEAFLHRCMAKDPAHRPQSASDFGRELMACFMGAAAPQPRATATPTPPAPAQLPHETLFSALPMSNKPATLPARPPTQEQPAISLAQLTPQRQTGDDAARHSATSAPRALTLTLDGAHEADAPISVSMTFHAEQRARAMRGLLLDSAPQGALVYVDGQPIGLTPLQYQVSGARPLHIKLEREGCEPYELAGYTPPDDREARVFALLRRRLIELEAVAPAAGFALSIQGEDYGVMPAAQGKLVLRSWPDGPLTVRMTHPRYEDIVIIIPSESIEARLRVAPARADLVLRPMRSPALSTNA